MELLKDTILYFIIVLFICYIISIVTNIYDGYSILAIASGIAIGRLVYKLFIRPIRNR